MKWTVKAVSTNVVIVNLIVVFMTAAGQSEMDYETASQLLLRYTVASGHSTMMGEKLHSDMLDALQFFKSRFDQVARNESLKGEKYRRIDGVGNNLQHPEWGALLHLERRLLDNAYLDKKGIPRLKGVSGKYLPNARTVTVKCILKSEETAEFLASDISQLVVSFGQFVDHEVIATVLEEKLNCCDDITDTGLHHDIFQGGPCFPMLIEPNDRFFNVTCLPFSRAFSVSGENGVQEQVNSATSFVDGSNVYGSSEELAVTLRQFQGGLLKVTDDNSLPLANNFHCIHPTLPACPNSGESRVNEFPALTAMHTIFHREHNRIAEKLASVNPHWTDEKLFQEARKIIIAIIQKIIFEDYLPMLVGPGVLKKMGVDLPYVYDPTLDPSIINEFGIAPFRFGHTLLSGLLFVHKDQATPISELFFRPESIMYHGNSGLTYTLRCLSKHNAHKFDEFITRELSDKLFLNVPFEAGPDKSFDLIARNLQRSRDHGVRPYIDYLDYCNKKLEGIEGIHKLTVPTCLLKGAYESLKDVELFVGGVYETPVSGSILGPTFACIIAEQFRRLKFGDRFFYETQDPDLGFSSEQLQQIKTTTSLSAVICRNSQVKRMQPNAFMLPRQKTDNPVQPCSSFSDMNFSFWRDM